MLRLTREVRFAINRAGDEPGRSRAGNSYGGFPALTGVGQFFALQVTVRGELEAASSYLVNIKEIDQIVRERGIAVMRRAVAAGKIGAGTLAEMAGVLRGAW